MQKESSLISHLLAPCVYLLLTFFLMQIGPSDLAAYSHTMFNCTLYEEYSVVCFPPFLLFNSRGLSLPFVRSLLNEVGRSVENLKELDSIDTC